MARGDVAGQVVDRQRVDRALRCTPPTRRHGGARSRTTRRLTPDWLGALVGLASSTGAGVAGALVADRHDVVLHAGWDIPNYRWYELEGLRVGSTTSGNDLLIERECTHVSLAAAALTLPHWREFGRPRVGRLARRRPTPQFELYHRLSTRGEYRTENETSGFEVDSRIPFPYYTKSAETVSNQLLAIGFMVKVMALPPGASVLEYGAGWGNTTITLARMGCDVHAIDIDENFVDMIGPARNGWGWMSGPRRASFSTCRSSTASTTRSCSTSASTTVPTITDSSTSSTAW